MSKRVNLYARGGIWWTWWYAPDGHGKKEKLRKSTGQRDKSLARAAARRLRQDFLNPDQAVGVDEVLARFLASRERKGNADETLAYYVTKGQALTQYFGSRDAHGLKLADAESYLEHRLAQGRLLKDETVKPPARQTVTKEWSLLLSALRYAKRLRLYQGDIEHLRPDFDGGYVPKERALTGEEYTKLQVALDADRRDYLHAFVKLGPRLTELWSITPRSIATAAKMVHIAGTKTRASRRSIPVEEDTLAMLSDRADGRGDDDPIFPVWKNIRRDLAAACRRAGIPTVTPNDLRRTFATWLAEAGVPELVTASLMGHTSSQMVRRVYARIGSEAQKAAIARLPALGGVSASERAPSGRAIQRDNGAGSAASSTAPAVTLIVPDAGTRGGQDGHPGREDPRERPAFSGGSVPRDRVELPTRGFSVPVPSGLKVAQPKRKLRSVR